MPKLDLPSSFRPERAPAPPPVPARPRPFVASVWLLAGFVAASCGGSSGSSPSGGAAHGLAILSSDYAKSSVALYDPIAGKLTPNCIDSGLTDAVVKEALSGDVVLPSSAQPTGELVTIDRTNAVLTYIAPASCAARTQLSVSTGGFRSNPHDVIGVSEHKAYVTRYELNPAPTDDPNDFDEGDDLIVIDPSQPKILGRVGLSVYATSVPGQVIQARPDRGVLAGGLLYVTLGSLSASPSFSFAGPGRVVIVDPATDTVSGMVDLPDQTGCSGIDYRADTNRLYVSCGGEFSDGDQQVARSALVEIDLGGAAPTVGRILRASALGTQPFSYHAPIVVGDTALAVTTGAFDPTTNAMLVPDTAYAAPFDGSAPIKLLDGGAFNLGRPAADAPRTTIFLPDGNAVTPRVRTLDVRAAPWVAGPAAFEPDPVGHLPPREAVGY